MVFSVASTNGENVIQTIIPRINSTTHGWTVKNIALIHMAILTMNMVLSGDFPSHFFAIHIPPAIKQILSAPRINPHVCTDTRDNPYASISDINTPPRKLLNVVKKISPTSPGIPMTTFTVPFISIPFFAGSASCSGWALKGTLSSSFTNSIWTHTSTVIPTANTIAQPIPKNQITTQLAIDVNENARPFIVPILPFAFACSSVGKIIDTVVESAI